MDTSVCIGNGNQRRPIEFKDTTEAKLLFLKTKIVCLISET
jgi:hypothetical protein